MGKEKHLKKIESLFEKSPVVSYASIERIIGERKDKKRNKSKYAKFLIHYLVSKGRIKRLSKGYYTNRNDSPLAVFCFQPAYLGLQDALSTHNLWGQETIPIIITTMHINPGIRNILDSNVMIRRINKRYFFGIQYEEDGEIAFPYSDIEKTFIDMIYFKQPLDEETLKNFREKLNKKKLNSYLKHYPRRTRKIVLSYL